MESLPFSVVMSVYRNDKAEFFLRALNSITNLQTIKPSEIILVVDGPIQSEVDEVIKNFDRENPDLLKILRLKENGGLGNALRLAIENASFELIARMDSDDISAPNRFEQQIEFFKNNPTVDIVGGDISEFIGDEENIIAYRKVPMSDEKIKDYMKKRCPFNHVSVMYKKMAVQKAGGYLDLFWNEDYYLWIRMLECGAIMANTGTVLVNVRTGKDMYKRRGGWRYFKSEKYLQKYMMKHKIIGIFTYIANLTKRFLVQVLLPDKIRGYIFRRFARKTKNKVKKQN